MIIKEVTKQNRCKIEIVSTQKLIYTEFKSVKDQLGNKKTIIKNQYQFDLKVISKEELLTKRISKKPGFVYKFGDFLFYTALPKGVTPNDSVANAKHVCSAQGHSCCVHLSAETDEEGGCAKVRDIPMEFFKIEYPERLLSYVKDSNRIEKYDFITEGYESFNTSNNLFVVLNCEHVEFNPKKDSTKKKPSKNNSKTS